MPLEQTITIINNSGKIISTGKQLVSLFKEAKASYEEKKAQIKPEPRPLQRAQTFDASYNTPRRQPHDDYYEADRRPRYYLYDDAYSEVSSRRSHDSRASHSKRHRDHATRSRPALTESNLKTLSEVSSVSPSRAPPPPPAAYRSPYAETLPRDMALSKMDLNHAEIRALAPADRRHSFEVPRQYPDSQASFDPGHPHKEIDMDLAYGNIPPDLATRWDLDPAYQDRSRDKARDLVRRVEGLLVEANCVQHSAGAIIKNLQEKPESAAAVALTLAELSTAVTKVSPAVLGFLKGGSPAVFALLASPHFLVGTTIAVGVTAVMFGGWKIVKKVKEAKAAREALALEGVPMDRPAPLRAQTEVSAGFDEAVVLEEELSTIETWRRGIQPFGADDESADYELITPEAGRALYGKDDFDLKSRRSVKTTKTSKTNKTHKSHKSRREDKEPTEHRGSSSRRGPESEAGSERSKKSSRKRETKTIEDGRSRRGEDELDVVLRPRPQRQSSNMLKAIFKSKKEKERSNELVVA